MITPNRLTALRIVIAFISPLLLIWHRSFQNELIVLISFTIACITDWWDGHLARSKSMITWAGKIADPIADKLLILGLMFTFSFLGLYSFWWVMPILVREIVVTGIRLLNLKQGTVIPAETAGKIKVGFQIGSIYITLVFLMVLDRGLFLEPKSMFFVSLQMGHFLGILSANVVTILSGFIFLYRLNRQ